jgi:uncharacterized protein
MPGIDEIANRVRSTGFRCGGCSACCRRVAEDSNLVLVSPAEIRAIMEATGMGWEDVAEPYPDFIEGEDGGSYTFSWCIRRNPDACIFLDGGRCTIYACRPWICRTYPFMLDGDEVLVSACPGLGADISEIEANAVAQRLIGRQSAEEEEEGRVRRIYRDAVVPPGRRAVIDGEGVKVLDG